MLLPVVVVAVAAPCIAFGLISYRHVSKNGTLAEVESLWERMQKDGVPANQFQFNHMMDAYAKAGDQVCRF